MTPILLQVTGQVINLVGLVSPRTAGRLAFRLFSSTKSGKPSNDKERQLHAAAQASMAEATLHRLAIAGGDVAAWQFPPRGVPSGRTVLVIHGWGSRIDYLQALVGGLRDKGCQVIGLDLPGHGSSSGRRLTVPMAIEAIEAASQKFGPFDAAIGHSFGGFSLTLAAERALQQIPARLVLVAAPASATFVLAGFSEALGFSGRVRRALADQGQRITGHPVEHYSGPRVLAGLSVPTLVIHAEDDKEVGPEAARDYAASGPHVTLEWANGLGHRRIISAPEVIESIHSFIGGRNEPLKLSA